MDWIATLLTNNLVPFDVIQFFKYFFFNTMCYKCVADCFVTSYCSSKIIKFSTNSLYHAKLILHLTLRKSMIAPRNISKQNRNSNSKLAKR